MKKLVTTLAATLVFGTVALTGCEREVGEEGLGARDFEEWDTDRDGFLNENELRTGYGAWDRDRDGLISEQEFGGD